MQRALVFTLLAACGGTTAAPKPAEPAPQRSGLDDDDLDWGDADGSEGLDPDADCFTGPGANVFEARYEDYQHESDAGSIGLGLYVNICDAEASGPAQVITIDGHILDATAEIESEMEASYRIEAPGYTPPPGDEISGLVIIPAVPGARIVTLSSGELVAIGDAIQRDLQLGNVPPVPIGILGVDLDGDGRSEAALVHACFRMPGGTCTDFIDRFVHRLDTGWGVPYPYLYVP